MKKRLLSGVKPTGRPHIGNYFGAMKQFVDLQNEFDAYIMVADYHALNFIQDKKEMESNITDLILDYLAVGLDPQKVVLFKQSGVSAHTELAWIFDTITTMPYLMLSHAFKSAVDRAFFKNNDVNAMLNDNLVSNEYHSDTFRAMVNRVFTGVSVGTFNYPMLMAADILLYDPEIVPVGSDQKQHVEYARDTAQKFNNIFGEILSIPEPMIMNDVAVVPGTDGQKMSKSYKNTIPLFGTDEEIKKAVMSIVTDSKTPEEPKDPDTCNIFALHKLFLSTGELVALRTRYTQGGLGYKESKDMLFVEILTLVSPMRERREMYANNPKEVQQIITEGTARAKAIAEAKMEIIRKAIGVA